MLAAPRVEIGVSVRRVAQLSWLWGGQASCPAAINSCWGARPSRGVGEGAPPSRTSHKVRRREDATTRQLPDGTYAPQSETRAAASALYHSTFIGHSVVAPSPLRTADTTTLPLRACSRACPQRRAAPSQSVGRSMNSHGIQIVWINARPVLLHRRLP